MPRIYVPEFADRLGVPTTSLYSYLARGQAPACDGRDQRDGRRFWYPATVEAYLANRRADNDTRRAANHAAVALAAEAYPLAAKRSMAALARASHLPYATIAKHLSGRHCECLIEDSVDKDSVIA